MRAVIMAGGKGTRLAEITRDEIPKSMVKAAGKPILQRQIECLRENGVTEICIVTGYLGEKIREAFGDGSGLGVSLDYYHEKTALGTAGALAFIKPYLQSDFLLVFGDCIFDIDVQRMSAYHQDKKAAAALFVHPNSHPYDSDLIVLDISGRVTGFYPKNTTRDDWYDNMVNAGLYILSSELCGRIPAGKPMDLERDLLFPMISGGQIYGYRSSEYIKDAGTPERIAQITQDIETGAAASRNLRLPQKCVFIDRDGTVNKDNGLIYRPEDFELLPEAAQAIRQLNTAGFLVVVITNQPAVARGLCDEETIRTIHRKMQTQLGQEGAYLDGIYYCPHHPDKGYPEENPAYKIPCPCRKPGTGMIEDAIRDFNIAAALSWMVGDTTGDMQTGKNAGLKTVLVQTGQAGRDGKYSAKPDTVCADLREAAQYIISQRG